VIFIIDFDGTLSTEDSTDKLLERFADPLWRDIEADWQADRISAQECMRTQVRLVQADPTTLQLFFQNIQLDPSFRSFWHYTRAFAPMAVVSDGLDVAIRTALANAGLEDLPVFANRLKYVSPDRFALDLEFPYALAECKSGAGVCKCGIAQRLASEHGGPIVLIGDGKSDTCLARMADMVFAKSALSKYCEDHEIRHIRFESFADVLDVVKAWPTEIFARASVKSHDEEGTV
jgi:2,3-diketo-5-methylthio-1-phosphopentane phosphatase